MRQSSTNRFAVDNQWTIWSETDPSTWIHYFFLRRNATEYQDAQTWGVQISQEMFDIQAYRSVVEHVAYELHRVSGIDWRFLLDMLRRIDEQPYKSKLNFQFPAREPPSFNIVGYVRDRWGEANVNADKRAEELLLSHLDMIQRAQYEQKRFFTCFGNKTGLKYSVEYGRVINVKRYEKDGRVQRLCLVQEMNVPLCDQLLTQKMLIENDEETFLRKANWIQ